MSRDTSYQDGYQKLRTVLPVHQSPEERWRELALGRQSWCCMHRRENSLFRDKRTYTPFFFNCSPPKVVRGMFWRVYHMLTYNARHTNSKFHKISVFG
eukprot:sb/3478889/